MTTTRIVKHDAHNFAVQVLVEVEVTEKVGKNRVKTGETRTEWQDKGYYGHRLEWAAESALHQAMPEGEPVTPAMVKNAVELIVNATVGHVKQEKAS